MKNGFTADEQRDADLYGNAERAGNSVGALLQQRARESAKRSKGRAETNSLQAEVEIRQAANDIFNAAEHRQKLNIGDVTRVGQTSKTYVDAVAGFLAQAENIGAIVLTGDEIFVADYDLLFASLGRYIRPMH